MRLSRFRFAFLASLGHTVIELCSQFLPVVYPILVDTMGLSYTQVGGLALVSSLGTSLAQPLFGHLSDRWDPRQITVLSVAWIGLLMGLVGWANSYGLLVVAIGLGVLGSAAFHPCGATIASAQAGDRPGVSVSIFSVGGSIGSALSPLLIAAAVQRFGMRGTSVVTPVALFFCAILAWQFRQVTIRREEKREVTPAGERSSSVVRLILVVLAVMCFAWFQGSFRTYLALWIESQGQSLERGSQVLFVFLAMNGVGSLVGGAASDRMERWQMLALCLGLLVPVHWFFVSASGPLQWILVGLMGILLGATFPVSIVMAQETWTQGVGIASGLVMGLGWVPSGIGASVTGMIADRSSLEAGLRTLVVPALLGLGFIILYGAVSRRAVGKQEEALPA